MSVFFTIVIMGIQKAFPGAVQASFSSFGSEQITPAVQQLANSLASTSPTNALFSAFLGYNPMDSILSSMNSSVVSSIPQQIMTTLASNYWFPQTLQEAFMPALRISFIIGAVLCGIAAVLSAMRGQKYVYEAHNEDSGINISDLATGRDETQA
jgi:hypothetical protein